MERDVNKLKAAAESKPLTGTVPANVSPAVQAFTAGQIEERSAKIHAIIDGAAKELEALGVKYFIGALDRPTDKAYSHADIVGEDFVHILDMALPTRQDAVFMGQWVGHLIQARSKNKS